MKSFDEHLRDCRSLRPLPAANPVPTPAAVGYEIATPVRAVAPYPAFVTSAMDGYAVRVADVPGRLKVVGEVPAGKVPDVPVTAGSAVRIMTGSAVPDGTEAVVPVELTTADGQEVDVSSGIEAGRNIRGIGEDVLTGDVLLEAGQLVGAAQLAALVAHNVTSVEVRAWPRVAVVSTGDELVAFGTQPGPAQLVDSNGPGLVAAASATGAEVIHACHVGDDPNLLLATLDAVSSDVDLVVTSGGISMGAYDVVKAALSDRAIRFESVAIQPGKPQAWGRLETGAGFLGLPGNPVSALVSFELFGRAALGRERAIAAATLVDPVPRSPKGKRQFLRGTLAGGEVRLVGGPESHLIVGLAKANCLVVVAEERESVPAGELVQVISLDHGGGG